MDDLNESDVDVLSEGDFFDYEDLSTGFSPQEMPDVGDSSKKLNDLPPETEFTEKKRKRDIDGCPSIADLGYDPNCVEFSSAIHLDMAPSLKDVAGKILTPLESLYHPPCSQPSTGSGRGPSPSKTASKPVTGKAASALFSPGPYSPFVSYYSLGKEGKVVTVNDSAFQDANVSYAMIDGSVLPVDRKWMEALTAEQAHKEYYKAMSVVNGLSTRPTGDHSGLVMYNWSLVKEKAQLEGELKKTQTVNQNLSRATVKLKAICDELPGLRAEVEKLKMDLGKRDSIHSESLKEAFLVQSASYDHDIEEYQRKLREQEEFYQSQLNTVKTNHQAEMSAKVEEVKASSGMEISQLKVAYDEIKNWSDADIRRMATAQLKQKVAEQKALLGKSTTPSFDLSSPSADVAVDSPALKDPSPL